MNHTNSKSWHVFGFVHSSICNIFRLDKIEKHNSMNGVFTCTKSPKRPSFSNGPFQMKMEFIKRERLIIEGWTVSNFNLSLSINSIDQI